jgi:predicted TPR repeat methyltransferase/Tfp pilus assembly protein PilF
VNWPSLLPEAYRLHQEGNLEAAQHLYGIILENRPEEADIWHMAGVASWQQDDHGAAVARFSEAVARSPGEAHFHNNLGNALQGLERIDEAIDAYKAAISCDPAYPQAWTNLGVAHQRLDSLSEALSCHGRALELNPGHCDAQYNLGNTQLAIKDFDGAEKSFRAVLGDLPGDPDVLNNLGNCLFFQKRWDEARSLYAQAMRLRPGSPDLLLNLGLTYLEENRLEEAETRIAAALSEAPDHPYALLRMGDLLAMTDRKGLAEDSYRLAIHAAPGLAEAYSSLGTLLAEREQAIEAIKLFRQAIAIDPSLLAARVNLGNALHGIGRTEEARESYLHAQRRGADSLFNQGLRWHNTGQRDQAIEAYEAAQELEPDNGTIFFLLSALRGDSIEAAPSDYIEELFDAYAPTFEAHLQGKLSYQTPSKLVGLLPLGRQFRRALDLGCGTGLMGSVLRARCDELWGVDLSREMLLLAEEKGCYDHLRKGELMELLEPSSADLVIAADVLVYFGVLAKLFSTVQESLLPGGLLLFSTEEGTCPQPQLHEDGRFVHSLSYISETLGAAGLKLLESEVAPLRKEGGSWVQGRISLAEKA